MNYNDRATIYQYVEKTDALGSVIREKIPVVIPCKRGKLTHEQQMGFFGKYDLSAFKLHLQGHHEDLEEITYRNRTRAVRGVILHKHSTVVVV